ncbi:MAG: DUF3750 domain-containing protein [Patescibacteria group bacterium]
MTTQEATLHRLVDPTKVQVFVFTCPANIPTNIGAHPWFVINRQGALSRWEVLFQKRARSTQHWGHIFKDAFPPFSGISIFPLFYSPRWNATLLGVIEGEAAELLAQRIENSPSEYPFRDAYFILGPNSNTYGQWALNALPTNSIKLPWNAFGKNHKARG